MPQASSGWSRFAWATMASYVAWSMVSTAPSLVWRRAGSRIAHPVGCVTSRSAGLDQGLDEGLLEVAEPLVDAVHLPGRVLVVDLVPAVLVALLDPEPGCEREP